VRQVEAKAIRKLQHPVRARKLQGFVDGSVYREVRGEMDSASQMVERDELLQREASIADLDAGLEEIDEFEFDGEQSPALGAPAADTVDPAVPPGAGPGPEAAIPEPIDARDPCEDEEGESL
jgi:hypothetical protein